MSARFYKLNCLLVLVLSAGLCQAGPGKSYSSGGGHSYSSHSSSSHSSGFSGNHNSGNNSSRSSSGGSSRSSGSSKSFSSGSGKSYSSGSNWNDTNRKSYSSGKSYTSGTGNSFRSTPRDDKNPATSTTRSKDNAGSSGFAFDTAAARARKEEVSKEQFTKFKQSQSPGPISPNVDYGQGAGGGSYRRPVYVPDGEVIRTRPVRVYNVYHYYNTRPWITYRDPYSSFFCWWLLDRTLDDRAWWAYHHRYDMDPARYDALLATDAQLQARVAQLEAQQAARNPNYVPPGLDRDLMYSDQYVKRAYSNRPTRGGTVGFWIFGVPLAIGFCAFFIWLIWFKRWQTAS